MSPKSFSLSSLIRRNRRVLFAATVISSVALLSAPLYQAPWASHTVLDVFGTDQDVELSAGAPPPSHVDETPSIHLPQHQRIEGGRLKVTLGGAHPFHDLIADAETKWHTMLERYVERGYTRASAQCVSYSARALRLTRQ
jgi:hypothetical protein